ncbi:MAG: FkbM family methyltransferase [Xanthobacteraceae bacterium]
MITDRIYRFLMPLRTTHRFYTRIVRRLPHRTRIVRHFDQSFFIDPTELSGFYLYYEQEYDDHVFDFLSSKLASFAWAIDLGANIGLYTAFLARFCNRVDAFEPDENLVLKLQENLRLNHINNVKIHAKCISDTSGVVNFATSSIANLGTGKIAQRGISLPSVSLNDFLAESKQEPLFIKMDIEGAEWLAIQGAKQRLSSWSAPLSILMEVHPDDIGQYGGSLPELQATLEGIGFDVRSLESNKLHPVIDSSRFWWISNE